MIIFICFELEETSILLVKICTSVYSLTKLLSCRDFFSRLFLIKWTPNGISTLNDLIIRHVVFLIENNTICCVFSLYCSLISSGKSVTVCLCVVFRARTLWHKIYRLTNILCVLKTKNIGHIRHATAGVFYRVGQHKFNRFDQMV